MSNDRINIDEVHDSPSTSLGGHNNTPNKIKDARLDVISTADDNINITEPSSPTHSEYPYNSVRETLSGHVKEYDDTPGAERIMEMHKSGTFYEIHPDGTRVLRVYGDDFEISLNDKNLIVSGNLNITVEGNANILTKGNVKQKVGGDYELIVHGNMTTRVHKNRLDYTKENHDIQTFGNLAIRTEGKVDFHTIQNINIQTQSNMIIDCNEDFTSYTNGSTYIKTDGNYYVKSSGLYSVRSDDTVYLDAPEIHFNLPGPNVSISNPESNDPTDKDPTGGLTIEKSVVEPSFENIKLSATLNETNIQISDTNITYPKNRTPLV